MTKKRQSSSSVISVMDDDALDLQDISEDSVLDSEHDAINYMNVDISTDNIEDNPNDIEDEHGKQTGIDSKLFKGMIIIGAIVIGIVIVSSLFEGGDKKDAKKK